MKRFCILIAIGLLALTARADVKPTASFQNTQGLQWRALDINAITCAIASDGAYADFRRTGMAGLGWPKGERSTAVNAAGVWLAGRHGPSGDIRTAVIEYASEFQPGPLLETFNTTTNDDTGPVSRASDPRYRLYKITRGDTLALDYQEWPGELGAPFEDVNGNGVWEKGIDRPRFYGDQQIWCVVNDVNRLQHSQLGATEPMGLEMRILYFASDQPNVVANTMFVRWQLINKSDADYDSVYASLWSDVDLGNANDDLPGSDTTLHMGYAYNGDDSDEGVQGYGSTPPAIGFVYLQGPIVPGLPSDTARFLDGRRGGFRNLGMTSYVPSNCGTFYPELICPPDGSADYAPTAYAYQQGKLGGTKTYLTRPDGSIITYFFSGDPVTGTGDLPHNFPLGVWNPQELYMMANTGPFTLARGDTQEFTAAVVISQGLDRLESIRLLRRDVSVIREYVASGMQTIPGCYLSVTPTLLQLDSTEVGTESEPVQCILTGGGSAPVTVLTITGPASPNFSVSGPTAPFSLAFGEQQTCSIRFTPRARGTFHDTLLFVSNDSTYAVRRIPLHGTAFSLYPALPGPLYGCSTKLHSFNPESGAALGSTPFPNASALQALCIRPSTRVLHGVLARTGTSSALHRICSKFADLVPVCTIPLGNLRALAFTGGDSLYAGNEKGQLYRIDIVTGDTIPVGSPTGLRYMAFSFHPTSGALWAAVASRSVDDPKDRIYTIDITTGQPALVGRTGDNLPVAGIAFSPDGRLFGVKKELTTDFLMRISTATAQGTTIASLGTLLLSSIVMRTDSLAVLGVGPEADGLPALYALDQNYPNPFNASTMIRLVLPEESFVTLRIYDALGREIRALVEERLAPGVHLRRWDGRSDGGVQLASGIYIARFEASSVSGKTTTILRKMVFVR